MAEEKIIYEIKLKPTVWFKILKWFPSWMLKFKFFREILSKAPLFELQENGKQLGILNIDVTKTNS